MQSSSIEVMNMAVTDTCQAVGWVAVKEHGVDEYAASFNGRSQFSCNLGRNFIGIIVQSNSQKEQVKETAWGMSSPCSAHWTS